MLQLEVNTTSGILSDLIGPDVNPGPLATSGNNGRPESSAYQSLFDSSAYPMWTFDIDTLRFIDVNQAAIDYYGWSKEEFKGMTVLDIRPPDEQARYLAQRSSGASRSRQTWRHVKRDGTPIHVEVTPLALMHAEHTMQTMLVVDVTDRVLAEEALRRGQEELLTAQAVAHIGSWQWEPGCDEIIWSAELYRINGYEPGSGTVTLATALQHVHPDDIDNVNQALQEAIDTQSGFHFVYRITRPDGQLRHLEARGECVKVEDGKAAKLIGTVHDITERIEAEAAHEKLEERLRQSQKMEAIGKLAGGVAHDFNNMLTVIIAYSQMSLGKVAENSELHEYTTEVLRAGERAAQLTHQLLAFSRQQVLTPKVLDLNPVVAETERMLQRLIGEDIAIYASLAPQLDPILVDHGQIIQVILNLAVNARDAMPRGGKLTIQTSNFFVDDERARLLPEYAPGPHVLLSISDNGSGMTPEVRERIFEPFFTTKGPGQGTGLGLATVYGIIQQSGGQIEVYSEPGTGTTFKIYFPAVEQQARAQQAAIAPPALRGTETLLLVEDDPAVRKVAVAVLVQAGYEVLVAASGREALELAARQTTGIDLLVTDLIMPEMSGRQVAEAIAQILPGVRVLYMSGYTDDAVVRHGLVADSVAFLQKPFTSTSLSSKVREVLDGPGVKS